MVAMGKKDLRNTGKSYKTLVVNIYPQRLQGRTVYIEPEIKFSAVDQQRSMDITKHLLYIV